MKRVFVLFVLVFSMMFVNSGGAQDSNNVLRAAIDMEPTSLNPYFTIQQAAYNFIDLYLLRPWLVNDTVTYSPILVDELPIDVEGGVTVNNAGQSVVRFTLKRVCGVVRWHAGDRCRFSVSI